MKAMADEKCSSPDVLRCEDIETPRVVVRKESSPILSLMFFPTHPYNIRSSHSSF
jgi:hypothetical protein